jgi:selenocysteine lyase/cysteine desulfurase
MIMVTRRRFLGSIGIPSVVVAAGVFEPNGLSRALEAIGSREVSGANRDELAQNEDFWFEIQQAFTVDRTIVNLNNGGVSPSPLIVNSAMKRYLDYSNMAPVYSMWKILEPQRETVRTRLATAFGCDPEEVALTRNASEGLQICQFGFDLIPGDEVLTTDQDYPRMITTWKQSERRRGVVLKQFSIPVPAEDEDEVVSLFERNITSRTRLILMCHMINLTGQILPVKKVARMARKRGIPVIVDGAHTFAHFEFTQADLDCDYFATSLHKWLFAPHGTGMLYVRRDKIDSLWPMMAAPERMDEDIRKFEEIGTHPAAGYLAIGDALTFHEGIGPARKEARMRYLRDYWVGHFKEDPRVRLNTSLDPRFSCGLTNIRVQDVDSEKLSDFLWAKHRILVTPIKHKDCEGIRVTPSVYTTLAELDRFCDVLGSVVREGLPT